MKISVRNIRMLTHLNAYTQNRYESLALFIRHAGVFWPLYPCSLLLFLCDALQILALSVSITHCLPNRKTHKRRFDLFHSIRISGPQLWTNRSTEQRSIVPTNAQCRSICKIVEFIFLPRMRFVCVILHRMICYLPLFPCRRHTLEPYRNLLRIRIPVFLLLLITKHEKPIGIHTYIKLSRYSMEFIGVTHTYTGTRTQTHTHTLGYGHTSFSHNWILMYKSN